MSNNATNYIYSQKAFITEQFTNAKVQKEDIQDYVNHSESKILSGFFQRSNRSEQLDKLTRSLTLLQMKSDFLDILTKLYENKSPDRITFLSTNWNELLTSFNSMNPEDVQKAKEKVCASVADFLERLPEGYENVVTEFLSFAELIKYKLAYCKEN